MDNRRTGELILGALLLLMILGIYGLRGQSYSQFKELFALTQSLPGRECQF